MLVALGEGLNLLIELFKIIAELFLLCIDFCNQLMVGSTFPVVRASLGYQLATRIAFGCSASIREQDSLVSLFDRLLQFDDRLGATATLIAQVFDSMVIPLSHLLKLARRVFANLVVLSDSLHYLQKLAVRVILKAAEVY